MGWGLHRLAPSGALAGNSSAPRGWWTGDGDLERLAAGGPDA